MASTNGFHENFHAEEPAIGSDRSFCLFFAAIFAAAAVYFRGQPILAIVCACLSAALLLLGLTRPALAAPLNRAWGKLGLLLARITNPVILGLLYLCIIVPIGLLLQLSTKLRGQTSAGSYWVERTPPTPASMADQF